MKEFKCPLIGFFSLLLCFTTEINAKMERKQTATATSFYVATVRHNQTPDDSVFLNRFLHNFDLVRNNLSSECVVAYDYYRSHQYEEWALKMLDANAKIESGMIDGNLQFLGSFDECLSLKIVLNQTRQAESTRTAQLPKIQDIQYCTINFPISLLITKNEISQYPSFLLKMIPPSAGICLPAACTAQYDLPIIFGSIVSNQQPPPSVMKCFTKQDLDISNRLEAVHVIIISLFGLLFFIIFLATILEQFESIAAKNKNDQPIMIQFVLCFGLQQNLGYLFHISKCSNSVKSNRIAIKNPNEASGDCNGTRKTCESRKGHRAARAPQIDCLDGIRVLSFMFILIYHTFTEALVPSANLLEIIGAEHDFLYQLVTNAALWVDTFFLLSGFLVAHSSLYQTESSLWNHLRRHPKRLLHRYIRLTPSVLGVVSLSILIEVLGSGPLWQNYVDLSKNSCHHNWWNLFLYINNICHLNSPSNPQNECLSYLWYLAVDMQFYLISPVLIMFLCPTKSSSSSKSYSAHRTNGTPSRRHIIGIAINVAVILASWIITAILMSVQHLTPTVLVNVYDLDYINLVYKQSYCRIGPYSMGILLAYFLRERQLRQERESLILNDHIQDEMNQQDQQQEMKANGGDWHTGFMLLVTGMFLLLSTTLLTYPWLQGADYHNAPSILYGAIHRSVWALGWALLIWAFARNHLPLLNAILSHGIMKIFSKLTYQSYLLHSVLISAIIHSLRQKIYFSNINFSLDVIRYFFLTQMISILTFVIFERPFINLENRFLRSTASHRNKINSNENNNQPDEPQQARPNGS